MTDKTIWSVVRAVEGRAEVVGNGETAVVLTAPDTLLTTSDGSSFATPTLPPPSFGENSYLASLTFMDALFWVRRNPTWLDDSHTEYFSSSDGLTWLRAEAPEAWEDHPENVFPAYEGWVNYAQISFPLIHENTVKYGQTTVTLTRIDDRNSELWQREEGTEAFRVNTAWSRPDETEESYPEAWRIIEKDGVILCLNSDRRLGRLEPEVLYLAQPVREFIWHPEDSYTPENEIGVKWSAVDGAESYQVWRKPGGASDSEAVLVAETPNLQWIDSDPNLARSQHYSYRVIATAPDLEDSIPREWWRSLSLHSHFEGLFILSLEGHVRDWVDRSFGENWEWWEDLNTPKFPWVYSPLHGWWYLEEVRFGFWTYDQQLGWFWTDRNHYPTIFVQKEGAWLYYLRGTTGPRWFYDYSVGDWVTD